LLKKDFGIQVNESYRALIDEWVAWWGGFVEKFHQYNETAYNGATRTRQLFSLRMAKKVCEDWASYLLNDKTRINIDDKASSEYLLGESSNTIGGVLGDLHFWDGANGLVEKAFAGGTGAIVLAIDGLEVSPDTQFATTTDAAKFRLAYLSAPCIYPITVEHGEISEVAFVSESLHRGEKYALVEAHTKHNGQYVVENKRYVVKDGEYTEAPLPDGIAATVYTRSPHPWFVLITPNKVNTHSSNFGMGCSVFSEAIDQLKGTDIALNNAVRDLLLGGKKVFYNGLLTKTVGVDKNGNPIQRAPDDVMQQLFVSLGDDFVNPDKLVSEFNPDLRVEDNTKAIQAQLNYLSFKCGMGTGHYYFGGAGTYGRVAITATQYIGEKQEIKQNAAKHGINIERALVGITRAMLWAAKEILGKSVDPTTVITVEFSDGYITSDEALRAQDTQDVRDGLMQPWEYRVRWFGEDEQTAKSMTQTAPMAFGGHSYPPGEDGV